MNTKAHGSDSLALPPWSCSDSERKTAKSVTVIRSVIVSQNLKVTSTGHRLWCWGPKQQPEWKVSTDLILMSLEFSYYTQYWFVIQAGRTTWPSLYRKGTLWDRYYHITNQREGSFMLFKSLKHGLKGLLVLESSSSIRQKIHFWKSYGGVFCKSHLLSQLLLHGCKWLTKIRSQ